MRGARSIEEDLAALARAGGVKLTVDVDRYTLVGSTLAHLRRSAILLGPRTGGRAFLAWTDWDVAWRVDDLGTPSVQVTGVVRVPPWRPPRSASSFDVEAWRRIAAAIEAHERRHLAFGVDAALRVRRVLVEMRPEGSRLPVANGEALRAAIDCELDDVREQERRFDEITAHGARDGVAL